MHPLLVGTVSLGSVAIPVRVYAAKEEREGQAVQRCARCLTPVQLRKWCPVCAVELAPEDIVRDANQGVPGLEPPAKPERGIVVTSFVRLSEVDPLYFEKSYYLEPVKPEVKNYKLLKKALETTSRGAVALATLRTRQVPALLRGWGRIMVLHTLTRPEELRRASALESAAGRVGAKDLRRMQELISGHTLPFPAALAHRTSLVCE